VDLRTKLVFSLVAVALVSMLALGTLAYRSAEEPLTRRTLRQLDALAQVRESQLLAVVAGWQERVRLVASRTQLRRSLREYGETGGAGPRERIAEILEDAAESSRSIRSLEVYDMGDRLVAGTGDARNRVDPDAAGAPGADGVRLVGIRADRTDSATVVLSAPLFLDEERIGSLVVVLATDALLDITADYTGLGETGEAMIVVRGRDGEGRFLNPVRHPDGPVADRRATGGQPGISELSLAIRGEEGTYTEGIVDYRGEPVWAAVRLLPELDLGLVVKFDEREELTPLREFRERLLRVGFSLSALAILAGVLLGLHFSRPIHDLAGVADRVRGGDLGARADAGREDELGVLAGAFNAMGDELERRLTQLQEYKRFFDHSRDMLCVAGTDGYFKRVNPAFERTLGWPEQELLGRPFFDFVHPEDVDKTIAETERLAQGIPTISFENRYLLPDGRYARLQWTCYPDTETGQLYAAARVADPAQDAKDVAPHAGAG
jgi:PAS domain S-box-containing protein